MDGLITSELEEEMLEIILSQLLVAGFVLMPGCRDDGVNGTVPRAAFYSTCSSRCIVMELLYALG